MEYFWEHLPLLHSLNLRTSSDIKAMPPRRAPSTGAPKWARGIKGSYFSEGRREGRRGASSLHPFPPKPKPNNDDQRRLNGPRRVSLKSPGNTGKLSNGDLKSHSEGQKNTTVDALSWWKFPKLLLDPACSATPHAAFHRWIENGPTRSTAAASAMFWWRDAIVQRRGRPCNTCRL